ncbi:two component transcriptional regulator, LuxR family [Oscillospiraceae bacterium]|nr:two component transcriptional regulator, LuxR family [Oscillospiraceae bacterium]
MTMRVLIVDDDPLVSGALKVILEAEGDMEVTGVASGGAEAVDRALGEDAPDVIVMDIRMDGMNGIEAAEKILAGNKDIKILFLTTFLDDEYINKALSLGASGYILKQECATLASSVRAVRGGQIVFGGKIVEKLPDLMNRKEKFDYDSYGITDKEKELIEMVAEGLSNKEISEKMFLGEGTVRNMMSSVLSKLDLRDRTQLACFYYQKIKP